MNSDIETTSMNRSGKFFRLIDGIAIEWAAMLDRDLNPTDNPNECFLAIYQLGDLFKGADTRLFRDEKTNAPPTRRVSDDEIVGVGFNRREKHFRLDNNDVLRFLKLLDCDLNPTENADKYVVVIVQLPSGLYRALDVRMFDDHPDLIEITN